MVTPPMCRSWCYTLNNYTEDEVEAVRRIQNALVHWCSREVGESGTPHIQGYVRFEKPCRLAALKKILPRAHWEVRKGTESQAAHYCMKDGDVLVKIGEVRPDKQAYVSRREECDEVIRKINEEGMPFKKLRQEHPQFCFWHRRQVLDWKADNARYGQETVERDVVEEDYKSECQKRRE